MIFSALVLKVPARVAAAGLALLTAAIPGAARAGDAGSGGAEAFVEHCAVCHGMSGEGDGPYATMLRSAPADLTLLAKNNGGAFPTRRVERTIDGRSMPAAHGVSDMPIWGRHWKSGSGRTQEADVKARLLALIAYLQTIQK